MLGFMFEVTQTVTTLLMSTSLILTNNDDDDDHNDSYQDRPHLKQLKIISTLLHKNYICNTSSFC